MAEFDDIPVLVPEGKTFTDLTMGELDVASYHLKADVLECIAGGGSAKRYGAFVEVAILWAKRSGATEARDVLSKRFRDYEPAQMFHALRNKGEEGTDGPDELGPTQSSDESRESSSLESSEDFPAS